MNGKRINKPDLKDVLHAAFGGGVTKKDAGVALDAVLEKIVDTVRKGGEVGIQGFGTFFCKVKRTRKGTNPQDPSGPKMVYEGFRILGFRPSKSLRMKAKGRPLGTKTLTRKIPA
jgi:DNA-binding protein HU-beta